MNASAALENVRRNVEWDNGCERATVSGAALTVEGFNTLAIS